MDEGIWIIEVALYLEIWWELTETWSQNYDCKNIGGLERDCHICISKYESAKSNSAIR